jgi:DNA polymerase elongation subunit (family B)
MKLTVTEIAVHKEGESPIFGEIVTHVKLDDEGAGMFIKITQSSDIQMNEIRLDFNEVEYIIKAIEMLKESAGDQIE